MPIIILISFGYLHCRNGSPRADRTEDVRRRLRDPAHAAAILESDGLEREVQDVVLSTPGAPELVDSLVQYAESVAATGYDRPLRLAVGSAGGKHRAPALIELTAAQFRRRGYTVEVKHLDIYRTSALTPAER